MDVSVTNQYHNKSWLINAYVTKRKTMKDIAAECSVAATTILYFIRKYNIDRRSRGQLVTIRGRAGQIHGHWKLREIICTTSKTRSERWIAECHCGTIKEVELRHLLRGRSTSCGHCFKPVHRKPAPGDKLYSWTLIAPIRNSMWRAACFCGKISIVSISALRSGNNKSCRTCGGLRRRGMKCNTAPLNSTKTCAFCAKEFACRTGDQYRYCSITCRRRTRHATLTTPSVRILALLKGAIRRAKKLEIPFDEKLPEKIVHFPIECTCCGVELDYVGGRGIRGHKSSRCPSIDRVVPALGYIVSNVEIVCVRCNAIKRDASRDDLQKILTYIDEHARKQACDRR